MKTKQWTVSKLKIYGLLILLVFTHMISYFLLKIIGLQLYNYILKPLFWMGASVMLLRLKPLKTELASRKRTSLRWMCLLAGAGYVTSYMLLGVVKGFGLNPYDISFGGIFRNLLQFYPYYFGLEVLRYRLINQQKKEDARVMFILIVITYTVLAFNPVKFSELTHNNLAKNVEFIGSELLPSLVLNILLTRAAQLGGWAEALILKLFYESIFFFFKVLPNLDWLTRAFLNIMVPLFTYYLLNDFALKEDRNAPRRQQSEKGISSILTYGLSILIVWFFVGVFPIFPTLVLTGSMEPAIYPGDIVLMRQVDKEDLAIGDVIQYHTQNFFIIHRIIEIEEGLYITKGDNNNVKDSEPVHFEQIKGKLIQTIPKIGKPILFIKGQMSAPREEVEKDYGLGDKDEKNRHP